MFKQKYLYTIEKKPNSQINFTSQLKTKLDDGKTQEEKIHALECTFSLI